MTDLESIQTSVRLLDEDHNLLMGQMEALGETLALIREDEQPEARILPVLEQLRHYFLDDLSLHLQKEERDLFPAIKQLLSAGEGQCNVDRLAREHLELRQAIEQFSTAVTRMNVAGPETQRSRLWRLVSEARAILSQLKRHASFEDKLMREVSALAGNRARSAASPNDSTAPAA